MRKKISAAGVILSFLCLLWVDVFPQAGSQAQSEFQKAIEAGKKLYESGDHEKAIIKLFEAQNLAREKRDLAEACFHISLCYYALSESENCLAYLRKAFEAYPEKDIDERLFPPRFVGLFYQTKRDVLKAAPAKPEVKTEEKKIEAEKKAEPEKKTETEKKDEKRTEPTKKIEPPKIEEKKEPEKRVDKKPEEQKPPAAAGKGKQDMPARKKGKFPWLIAGGVALAGGVAAILLSGKAGSSPTTTTTTSVAPTTGNISVTSTPTGAKVFLDGTDTGQATNCTLANIAVGTHALKLVLDSYRMWEGSVQVLGGQTTNVAATLVGYSYEFVSKWGSQGSGDGQFSYPQGLTVDSSGNIYVADTENGRIQKFTSSGGFITKWGSLGSGDGQFIAPVGIAVDSSGNVYIADANNDRIQKFTSSGGFITKWGSPGSGDGQFNDPKELTVDSSGNVYVADANNDRIQKFTSSGGFITKWGSQGSGDGQFQFPCGIAVDNSGYVYVAQENYDRIQKFTSSGGFITKWGSPGSGDGQLNYPQGLTADNSGNVYVADANNDRIQKFTSSGGFITKWGSQGSGDGQFQEPCGVTVDSSGYVYVADRTNHRVQKFRMRTDSPLPATITYTSLRDEPLRENSARQGRFFSDPRAIMPFGFSREADLFNFRQAPPLGLFRAPGSPNDFFRMPGMAGDQIIPPRGVYGLPDVSNKFGGIPQKVTSAAVPGSSVAQKIKKD